MHERMKVTCPIPRVSDADWTDEDSGDTHYWNS